MNFNLPIMAEVEETDGIVESFREYLVKHNIPFEEEIEDNYYVGSLHIFKCTMDEKTLLRINLTPKFDAVCFYQ